MVNTISMSKSDNTQDVNKVEDNEDLTAFDPDFSHDKLVNIANKMRNSSMGSATSFSGSDAISWLQKHAGTSENESVFLGQKMMDMGWFSRTGAPKQNAAFQNMSNYHFPRQLVLNMKQMCTTPPEESAIELSISLLTRMVMLIYKNYDLHDTHPSTRDYLIFTQQVASKVKALEQYNQLTYDVGQLQGISLNNLTDSQKRVFWINVYNLICLHGAIELEAKYTWSRFFNDSCYSIGHEIYTLNEIENGILRGNAASVLGTSRTPPFPDYDLRLMHVISKPNPNFHFLKTCNTKSSPVLFVLTEENYESQLKEAAASFCTSFVNIEDDKVVLPKLFSWYRADFGKNDFEVLEFIAEYCEDSQRTKINELIENKTFFVAYSSYDWSFAYPQISNALKEMIVSVM